MMHERASEWREVSPEARLVKMKRWTKKVSPMRLYLFGSWLTRSLAAAKHAAFVRARGRHYSNEAEAMKVSEPLSGDTMVVSSYFPISGRKSYSKKRTKNRKTLKRMTQETMMMIGSHPWEVRLQCHPCLLSTE
jgi:hypothetical protein